MARAGPGVVLCQLRPGDASDVGEQWRRFPDCPYARDVDNVPLQLDLQMAVDDVIRFTSGDPQSPIFCLTAATFSHPGDVTGSSERQIVSESSSTELQPTENTTTLRKTSGKCAVLYTSC